MGLLSGHSDVDSFLRGDEVIDAYSVLGNGGIGDGENISSAIVLVTHGEASFLRKPAIFTWKILPEEGLLRE